MILIRFAVPLIYCILAGGAYSVMLRKRFADALAPAFFVHIILVLLSGLFLGRLSFGIYAGLLIIVAIHVYMLSSGLRRQLLISVYDPRRGDRSIVCVVLLYFLVYILNYGKYYSSWDEFTHWGLMLKESLRIDALYCTSRMPITHKDYVPAITLFETLWCRLSFRFSEADSYRGIQMLQASMLLPAVLYRRNRDDIGTQEVSLTRIAGILARFIVFFGLPLYFTPEFYHTIYQDLIYGVMVFYCMWLIISAKDDYHKVAELTLALTVLAMSKMTAVSFLPMIILFYMLYTGRDRRFRLISLIPMCVIPTAFWAGYNSFVSGYIKSVQDGMGGQMYSDFSMKTVMRVFSRGGLEPWQADVRRTYLSALFSRGIIGRTPYAALLLTMTALLVLFMVYLRNHNSRDDSVRVCMISVWIIITGAVYAFMMCFLYLVSFSEYEATYLASYERYMGTYVLAALLLGFSAYVRFAPEDRIHEYIVWFVAVALIQNVMMFVDPAQLIPGILRGEKRAYSGETDYVLSKTGESETICLIYRDDDLQIGPALAYYCFPRRINVIRPGMPKDDMDVWSNDISVDDLVDIVSQYDYVYFKSVDEEFIEKYSDAFEKPEIIKTGTIHSLDGVIDGKIVVLE